MANPRPCHLIIKQLLTAILATAALGAVSATADVVKIPLSEQADALQDLSRPARGLSQASVKQQFGEPVSQTGPVGEPPISTWEYPNFKVYFEHDHVVHTVFIHVPIASAQTTASN